MGYTNYWTNSRKQKFSPTVLGRVNKILATYEQQSGEKVVKGFFNKEQAPTVNPTLIHFNVNKEDSGEDFYINLTNNESEFCKTGREPYDKAVKAVLMVLQSAGYVKDWHFDGDTDEDEYKAGIKLLQDAGIKYTDKMIPRG